LIDRVPEDLKLLYATSFEIEVTWLIQAAARRQKWIDQAQSLNLYIAQASGTKLDALYREAWHAGLKTTYYLRSRSATHVEKSTVKRTDGKLNAVSRDAVVARACTIDDPTCEACQ
jgi:ribonucleoside-diphosphate reductase alpha chain